MTHSPYRVPAQVPQEPPGLCRSCHPEVDVPSFRAGHAYDEGRRAGGGGFGGAWDGKTFICLDCGDIWS